MEKTLNRRPKLKEVEENIMKILHTIDCCIDKLKHLRLTESLGDDFPYKECVDKLRRVGSDLDSACKASELAGECVINTLDKKLIAMAWPLEAVLNLLKDHADSYPQDRGAVSEIEKDIRHSIILLIPSLTGTHEITSAEERIWALARQSKCDCSDLKIN